MGKPTVPNPGTTQCADKTTQHVGKAGVADEDPGCWQLIVMQLLRGAVWRRSVESEEQCEKCGGEDGLAESAMANAGLITFATQGESAGRSSGRRTDQQHKQGSGKPITTKIRIKD